MSEPYEQWYGEFKDSMQQFDEDALFKSLSVLLHSSRNTFAMNRKLMQKAIDVSWVETIEKGLLHVDNVLRNPRRTIEDVEEIVPIALSRKITVESVKHLAQHTDLIQSVDERTGKITPSKILNVHKEESLMTYENKFVNTLIDRLYIFINTRYEKLAQVAKDEEVYTLGYDTFVDDGAGGKMKIEVKMETAGSLDAYDDSGYTVWQRVEKLKKSIEGYKGSELCTSLGNSFIRPPVMRTNAIMKNVDLKACLTLWQYIESYDKVGYEINIEDTAVKPDNDFVEDFYRLIMLHLLLFRSSVNGDREFDKLKSKTLKPASPKFVKKFDKELSDSYNVTVQGTAGYITEDGELQLKPRMPENTKEVFRQINEVIEIEKAYQRKCEEKRLEKIKEAEEAERRRIEQERIEAARRAELERIQREKEEEERRLQEMLAKKRAEQEAERRERERLEQERLALLEEKRRLEEEERQRQEEERLRREAAEREAAERERIAQEKSRVRSELGGAEGINEEELSEKQDNISDIYENITDEEIEKITSESEEEFEDPRAVAAKLKLEQQKREKERAEAERAQRLKAQRQYFENKPFREIYKEYSRNPIYLIPRLIKYVLAMVFGIISENTDDPDFKRRRAELEEKRRISRLEKEKRESMEVYYRKYARTFRYRLLRSIDDRKFRRKRAKEMKGKPRPVYKPPVRTPEQEQAIRQEMKRLYREYHVSLLTRCIRSYEELKRHRKRS